MSEIDDETNSKNNNNEEEEEESENEEEEEDESVSSTTNKVKLNTVVIKKESNDTIILSKSQYDNILQFIDKTIQTNETFKRIVNKSNVSTEIQTDNILIVTEDQQKENESILTQYKNKIQEYENIISAQKEEITQLKTQNSELINKHETFSLNTKKDIEKLIAELTQLRNHNKSLTQELNTLKKNIELAENKNKTFDTLHKYPLLLNNITKYLQNNEKINLSKTNKKLWLNIYYKTKSEIISRRLLEKESLIGILTKIDTAEKFDIAQEDINTLFTDYLTNNRVSGIEIRNNIVKALVFLEKYVKIPLKNFKGPDAEQQEPERKQGFLNFTGLSGKLNKLSNVVSMISGNNDYNETTSSPYANVKVIQFDEDDFKNLFYADKHILETFNTDKSININFEYKTEDEIKDIINEFFKSQLPKTSYQTFITKICETFSELLFSCYLALKDIKNLEIVKHALYCRFMKYRGRSAEMEIEIRDMNQFAMSSKETKELLLKQKNEVEMKYNNALMTINQLNEEKEKHDSHINELNDKIKKNAEKYELFKTQIIKEYKNIQNDFSLTKKERDLLKGTLIDFKNYFMKYIGDDGELIEVRKEQ